MNSIIQSFGRFGKSCWNRVFSPFWGKDTWGRPHWSLGPCAPIVGSTERPWNGIRPWDTISLIRTTENALWFLSFRPHKKLCASIDEGCSGWDRVPHPAPHRPLDALKKDNCYLFSCMIQTKLWGGTGGLAGVLRGFSVLLYYKVKFLNSLHGPSPFRDLSNCISTEAQIASHTDLNKSNDCFPLSG